MRAGGVISSTSSCGPSTTIPGASTPVMRRAASKRSDARMPRPIAPVNRGERDRVALLECAAGPAASNVHGAPHAPADDERAAQLVWDVGRQEQVAVARAALGIAAGDVVEDADGHPPGGEAGEGVDVVHHVLAADDHLPRGRGRGEREHAAFDEPLGRVAGQQPRAGVQRVPAAGVVLALARSDLLFATSAHPRIGGVSIRVVARGANWRSGSCKHRSGHEGVETATAALGVDEQYASRHSAWLHCPARDNRRSFRVARLRRPSCGCIGTGVAALARAAIALHGRNGALSRAPHDCSAQNTIARQPSGGAGAFAATRARSNSQAQRAIASSSAGAAYGNPGGQLPARGQPYKSEDQPVDRDDDHPSRAGARVRRSGRPFRTRIRRVARADQMVIVKSPLLAPDHVADAALRLHEMGDVTPPGHQPPKRTFRALAGQFPQHTADGVLGLRATR